MKKILIDKSVADTKVIIKKRTTLCIAAGIAALVLNLLFTLLRNDANHNAMLLLNIAADIAAGFFITYFASFNIIPLKRCLKFSLKPVQTVSGNVSEISENTIRVLGFDCFAVTVDGRKVFLPDCADISINVGEAVTFGVAMNVVTGVEK